MGFLKDFIGQAATQLKQASPVQAGAARVAGRGPARRAGEGGLDFMSALHAHRHWKIRLADYVRSGSRDRMDYREVGRDDRSELGQWIHGDARRRWGHLPSFGLLRSTHALFHLAAGHIVLLHHQGRTAEALRLMRGGEYPRGRDAAQRSRTGRAAASQQHPWPGLARLDKGADARAP